MRTCARIVKDLPATSRSIDGIPSSLDLSDVRYHRGSPTESLRGPFEIILAADVVYRPDLFPLLISSFDQLASADTVIYLGFKERTARDREFFQLINDAYTYVMATRTNHLQDDVVVFRIQKKRRSYLFRSLESSSCTP